MAEPRYNRIAALMAEYGIDNPTLAKYVGVTKESVSLWRTNKIQPTLKRLYKIAEFFKVDVRDLLVPRTWPLGPSAADIAKAEKEKEKAKAKAKKK